MKGADKIRVVPLGRPLIPPPSINFQPATSQDPEVGYDLGKSYRGFSVGNTVAFYARPKGVKGALRRQIEGVIRRIERRYGDDFAIVRGRDDQTYDVHVVNIEIADAVTQLGKLTDADDD
jgi:hypothetical protein